MTPRALIVEDEAVIAMALELFLEELDCAVFAVAGNVQQALELATKGDFDFAFLDVNLNGQKAHVLPGVLERRGKPFAFVTGYGAQGVLAAHAYAPVVTKPFSKTTIASCLEELKARLRSALLHLLARIDAPEILLLHVAVEALAGDAAPFAVAAAQLADHAGRRAWRPASRGRRRRAVCGSFFQGRPAPCAGRRAANAAPSPPILPNRGSCARSRIRR